MYEGSGLWGHGYRTSGHGRLHAVTGDISRRNDQLKGRIMSKKVKFKLNKAGVVQLFTCPEVNAWLQQVGDGVAQDAEGMSGVAGAEYEESA